MKVVNTQISAKLLPVLASTHWKSGGLTTPPNFSISNLIKDNLRITLLKKRLDSQDLKNIVTQGVDISLSRFENYSNKQVCESSQTKEIKTWTVSKTNIQVLISKINNNKIGSINWLNLPTHNLYYFYLKRCGKEITQTPEILLTRKPQRQKNPGT